MTNTIHIAPPRTQVPTRALRQTLAERAVQLHDDGQPWREVSVALGLSRQRLVAVLVASGYYATQPVSPGRW